MTQSFEIPPLGRDRIDLSSDNLLDEVRRFPLGGSKGNAVRGFSLMPQLPPQL